MADHLCEQVRSVDDDAEAKRYVEVLSQGATEDRRALVAKRIRKVVVGDAELTIELVGGANISRSLERVRHGNDTKLVIGEPVQSDQQTPDPQLLILLKDAQRARALAMAKPTLPLAKLAAEFGRSAERYKRLLRLSDLSPAVVASIVEQRQPAHLTNRYLQNLNRLPWSWAEQDQMLLG